MDYPLAISIICRRATPTTPHDPPSLSIVSALRIFTYQIQTLGWIGRSSSCSSSD